jgi:hypothetical protein
MWECGVSLGRGEGDPRSALMRAVSRRPQTPRHPTGPRAHDHRPCGSMVYGLTPRHPTGPRDDEGGCVAAARRRSGGGGRRLAGDWHRSPRCCCMHQDGGGQAEELRLGPPTGLSAPPRDTPRDTSRPQRGYASLGRKPGGRETGRDSDISAWCEMGVPHGPRAVAVCGRVAWVVGHGHRLGGVSGRHRRSSCVGTLAGLSPFTGRGGRRRVSLDCRMAGCTSRVAGPSHGRVQTRTWQWARRRAGRAGALGLWACVRVGRVPSPRRGLS